MMETTSTTTERGSAARADQGGLWLTAGAFALFGLMFGLWQVALPDLQLALQLSPGALGQALTLGFVPAFPMAVLGGRLADRFGARALLAGGAVLMALAFVGLAVVNAYGPLLALLFIFFGAAGTYDVGLSTAGIAQEQAVQRPLLANFHAAFSGGSATGALLGGALAYRHVPYAWWYAGLAAALLLIALLTARSGAVGLRPRGRTATDEAVTPAAALSVFRVPGLLALAGVALLAFFSEGSLEDWTAIYLRSALQLPAALGAAGPVVFHLAMLTGRLSAGRLQGRLGRRRLLQLGGLLSAGGMALALATPWPPLVLAGWLAAGLALAALAPVAYSLAGDLVLPERTGEVSAVVTTIGYIGFLIGPGLIGLLSDAVGLRAALGTLVVAGLVVVVLGLATPRALSEQSAGEPTGAH